MSVVGVLVAGSVDDLRERGTDSTSRRVEILADRRQTVRLGGDERVRVGLLRQGRDVEEGLASAGAVPVREDLLAVNPGQFADQLEGAWIQAARQHRPAIGRRSSRPSAVCIPDESAGWWTR